MDRCNWIIITVLSAIVNALIYEKQAEPGIAKEKKRGNIYGDPVACSPGINLKVETKICAI